MAIPVSFFTLNQHTHLIWAKECTYDSFFAKLSETGREIMDSQADGYYDEPELNSGELDLSFLDDDETKK